MYNAKPGLLIGFHGCDRVDQQLLLNDSSQIRMSDKKYEWLGHGFYFWENNYERALQWARDKQSRGKIKEAAVIGAVIDLMNCCDLLDTHFITLVAAYFKNMEKQYHARGELVPENEDAIFDRNKNKLKRFRDCATFQYMHAAFRKQRKREEKERGYSSVKVFDSVRGMFNEGGPAFDGAGFDANSHIQICIRNPNCIKGFFLRREEVDFGAQEPLLFPSEVDILTF